MLAVGFSFDPGVLAAIALATALYVRAVRTLARRGYDVPVGQQVCWHAGILLIAIGLLSPLDGYAEERLSAHMGQHLLIADLAAPLLLVGLRTPVLVFYLPRELLVPLAHRRRLRSLFRTLRRPLVAIPVWIVILYGWHFAFMFEAALDSPLVHVMQHASFVFGSVLVWWAVIDPKHRRLHADLWKAPYVLGARLSGMFLGMAFILMSAPAYGQYADAGLTDQQVAGAMMLGLDLLVMLFAVAFFFWRSAEEHDAAERAAAAHG
ncbi:MAG: cytochrome c oxidase assembly protein [Thermoleophilaceae bacterium]